MINAYANFTFKIDDNRTDLYLFQPGPVATVGKNTSPRLYLTVGCGTAFTRALMLSFDMKSKTSKQSPWLFNEGNFIHLHFDPLRQRLFGLRSVFTFTLVMEEYNTKTLEVIQQITQQDTDQYKYPIRSSSAFDYKENWIVEVRSGYESGSLQAYYLKMNLKLIGKKKDIVVEFYRIGNLRSINTMTYDIKTKTILITSQFGSINNDLFMFYMNPYTSNYTQQTLLTKTPDNAALRDIQAVFDEKTRHVLFIIHYGQSSFDEDLCWSIIVQFDTMKILSKKQINNEYYVSSWQLFNL